MLTRPGLELLTPEGAVPAVHDDLRGTRADATSFVTALGLRATRSLREPAFPRAGTLDFLEGCAAEDPRGAFGFWPARGRPEWAAKVPPDVDDTALCLLELHLGGRLSRTEAVRRAAQVLLPNRVGRAGAEPPWVAEGAYATWLVAPDAPANPVDCAVNANVLALFAALGLTDPVWCRGPIRLIEAGLAWAGTDSCRLRVLTPFYPDLREFAGAVAHAVDLGARELAAAALRLEALAAALPPEPDPILCSAAYSSNGWRSPALAVLRALPPQPLVGGQS